MTLNCKQGDIALIVRSACGNEGRIVRCLELLYTDRIPANDGSMRYISRGKPEYVWRIDQTITFRNSRTGKLSKCYYSIDAYMRPLRGDVTDDDVTSTFSINEEQPA